MSRKFSFLINEFYHIYNRGTDKRLIFLDEGDYQRFCKLLYLCNGQKKIVFRDVPIGSTYGYERGETFVDIGAYCLMPNHFHLLLREKIQDGVSIFMQKLSTAYSMYFNTKYNRSGGLFEGIFKAKHIDNEAYFNYVYSYIHLNPVKILYPNWKETGIPDPQDTKSFLSAYGHSSYFDYFITNRPQNMILNKNAFPEHFKQLNDVNELMYEFEKNKPIG